MTIFLNTVVTHFGVSSLYEIAICEVITILPDPAIDVLKIVWKEYEIRIKL